MAGFTSCGFEVQLTLKIPVFDGRKEHFLGTQRHMDCARSGLNFEAQASVVRPSTRSLLPCRQNTPPILKASTDDNIM